MIPVDRLKALRLFHGVNATLLERLAQDMNEKTFSKGQTVIKEGDNSGSLFLISSGSVSVEKQVEHGDEKSKAVARLESEEFFGEMSFLEDEPHSATIIAQEDTTLFVLPRAALDNLIKKDAPAALSQVLTLLTGVSSRLRRTTGELVTVFEVARLIGFPIGFDEFIRGVLAHVAAPLGPSSTVAFYRWNPFNDDYDLMKVHGPRADVFPPAIHGGAPLFKNSSEAFQSVPNIAKGGFVTEPLSLGVGHLVISRSDPQRSREGLFLYYNDVPQAFDAGKRQMMETVSAVLAPAFATVRLREEELARQRLERNRQAGTSL